MAQKPTFCPRCGDELENPRIGMCRACGCFRPGSARSQRLGANAPGLNCRNCPRILAVQVGQSFPAYQKGMVNAPAICPYCEAENATAPAPRYGQFISGLLTVAFWGLPLFYLLYLTRFWPPATPMAALDRLAAAPGWHGFAPAPSPLEALQPMLNAWKTFGIWALQGIPFYFLPPLAWLLAARERCAATRRAPNRSAGFWLTRAALIVLGGALFFSLQELLPVVAFVPQLAVVPLVLLLGLVAVLHVGLMLMLDRYLPLLAALGYQFYGDFWKGVMVKAGRIDSALARWQAEQPAALPLVAFALVLIGKVYGLAGLEGLALCFTVITVGFAMLMGLLAWFAFASDAAKRRPQNIYLAPSVPCSQGLE